ncbi:MAG: hypothetical protein ACRD12_00485, partial [Acidimicrobiales bacterium]
QILTDFGVEAGKVRSAVLEMLTGTPPAATPPRAGPSCLSCKMPLEENLGWKEVDAAGEPGQARVRARLFFCQACQTVIGVSGQ